VLESEAEQAAKAATEQSWGTCPRMCSMTVPSMRNGLYAMYHFNLELFPLVALYQSLI